MSTNKDALVAKIKQGIDDASQRIEEMKLKAAECEADTRMKWELTLKELNAQRDHLIKQLDQIAVSSGAAGDAMVKGFGESWNEFSKALQETIDRYQNKK